MRRCQNTRLNGDFKTLFLIILVCGLGFKSSDRWSLEIIAAFVTWYLMAVSNYYGKTCVIASFIYLYKCINRCPEHRLIHFQHRGAGQLQLKIYLSSSPYVLPLRDSLGNTRRKRSSFAKIYLRDCRRALRYIESGKRGPAWFSLLLFSIVTIPQYPRGSHIWKNHKHTSGQSVLYSVCHHTHKSTHTHTHACGHQSSFLSSICRVLPWGLVAGQCAVGWSSTRTWWAALLSLPFR